MNKLTPEQAAWLIEQFKAEAEEIGSHEAYWGFNACIEIINQCTEAEDEDQEDGNAALLEETNALGDYDGTTFGS